MASLATDISYQIDQVEDHASFLPENYTAVLPALVCGNAFGTLLTNTTSLSSIAEPNTTENISDMETWNVPFDLWETVIIALLILFCCIVTVAGNVLVLIAFVLNRPIRKPSNYYICSLAITDLIAGLVTMPIFATYVLEGRWDLGILICDLWLATDYTVCAVSKYTVLLITIDRYCSVKIAARYRSWRSKNKVLIIIALTWILSIVVFFTTILTWKNFTGQRELHLGKCVVQFWKEPVCNTTLIILYFFLTVVLLIFLYGGIYSTARQMQKRADSRKRRLEAFAKNRSTVDIITHREVPINGNCDDILLFPRYTNVTIPSRNDQERTDVEHTQQMITSSIECGTESLEGNISSSPRTDEEIKEKILRDTEVCGTVDTLRDVTVPTTKPTDTPHEVKKSLQVNIQLLSHCKQKTNLLKHRSFQCLFSEQDDVLGKGVSNEIPILFRDSVCYSTPNSFENLKAKITQDNQSLSNESSLQDVAFKFQNVETKIANKSRSPYLFENSTIPKFAYSVDSDELKNHPLIRKQFTNSSEPTCEDLLRLKSSEENEGQESKNTLDHESASSRNGRSDGLLWDTVSTTNEEHSVFHKTTDTEISDQVENNSGESEFHEGVAKNEGMSATNTSISSFCASVTTSTPKSNSLTSVRKSRKFWFRNLKEERCKSRAENRARKALRRISLILGAFVLCWTPYQVCALVESFCKNPDGCVDRHLLNFSYFLCYLNSPINPFCYAMANDQFKTALSRILKGDFRKN